MHKHFSYFGIDTVRFRATFPDNIIIDDHNAECPIGRIISPAGVMFENVRLVEGYYVFEFSAHAFYNWKDGGLIDPQVFYDLLVSLYGAEFLRIDLAAQIKDEFSASIDRLSYCRYFTRRSLQKKREPWAYWPSQSKTIKFYDKVLEYVRKNKIIGNADLIYVSNPDRLPEWLVGARTRFEVEYRSRAINQIFSGGIFASASFVSTYLHIQEQTLKNVTKEGLTRSHYAVLGMISLDIPVVTQRDKKLIPDLDRLGLLGDF